MALSERVQAKFVSNLSCIHSIWKILLVGKHKQHSIPQFILQIQQGRVKHLSKLLSPHKELTTKKYLVEHPVELIPSFNNTVTIIAINHKDKSLGVLEVMPPQWSDLNSQYQDTNY